MKELNEEISSAMESAIKASSLVMKKFAEFGMKESEHLKNISDNLSKSLLSLKMASVELRVLKSDIDFIEERKKEHDRAYNPPSKQLMKYATERGILTDGMTTETILNEIYEKEKKT